MRPLPRPGTPSARTALAALLALPALLLAGGCGGDAAGGDGAGAAEAGGEAAARTAPGAGTEAGQALPDTAGADSARADRSGDGREGRHTTTLRVGGHEVRAEVADRESERRRGLMGRDSLPEDHGMLFVYPEQRTLSFWMRDTKIPLDIAFVDRRGVIVDVQTMEPETEELHRSRQPAMYALEMAAGWFEEHGVEVGDRVEF